jgi:hypothetical protein
MTQFGHDIPSTSPFNRVFASWTRIEPRARSTDITKALAAPIADPLFMLGRQQQLRELSARDAGSPVSAKVAYQNEPLESIREGSAWQPLTAPVEVAAERESLGFEKDYRLRAQSGLELERRLRESRTLAAEGEALVALFRAELSLALPDAAELAQIDPATQQFLRAVAGQVLDGYAVADAVDFGATSLVPPVAVEDAIRASTVQALNDWRSWLVALHGARDPGVSAAWRQDRLDYQFSVRTGGATDPERAGLSADSYRNGDFDWSSVAVDEIGSDLLEPLPFEARPEPVTFHGMPDPRFWAVEGTRVDFGKLDLAKTDLVKSLLVHFTMVFGNDWFVIPFPLERGIAKVASVEVTDSFGQPIPIDPMKILNATGPNGFSLFGQSTSADRLGPALDGVFFLPERLTRHESDAVEEVRIVRDDSANMVFAIEQTVRDRLGNGVGGSRVRGSREVAFETDRLATLAEFDQAWAELAALEARRDAGDTTLAGDIQARKTTLSNLLPKLSAPIGSPAPAPLNVPAPDLSYRLSTKVPPHWIPFLPVRMAWGSGTQATEQITFQRGQMHPGAVIGEGTSAIRTRILESLPMLREEVVPRAGLRIQLTRQCARDHLGQAHTWVGRRVLPGGGEASSGLRFDVVVERGS